MHTTTIAVVCALSAGYLVGNYRSSSISVNDPTNPHNEHIKLAEQAQNGQRSSTLPSLGGDKNKRYTVSINRPDDLPADTDVPVSFDVYDAASGNPTTAFQQLYTKSVHMVVVNDGLTYFKHLHPEVSNNRFSMTLNLPADRYHVYLNFQPSGAIEQQIGFSFAVGGAEHTAATLAVDTNLTKNVGGYAIHLDTAQYNASQMSLGRQPMRFTIKDNVGHSVNTLQPYIGAFGHLTMVREDGYEYIHVHPAATATPSTNSRGGPTVSFLPLGLYGPIRPGKYRVFAEFNPAGEVIAADYTVEIK